MVIIFLECSQTPYTKSEEFQSQSKYKRFKIESIQNLARKIEPRAFIASKDLKNTFISVPIYDDHQKLLKFFAIDYNKFVRMPNRYGSAMRILKKSQKYQSHN